MKLSDDAFKNYQFEGNAQEKNVGTMTLSAATLTLSVNPVTITYGTKLGDVTLKGTATIGDDMTIDGTFAWDDLVKNTYPEVSNSNSTLYTVKFTPTGKDAGNFTNLTTTIQITVNPFTLTPKVESVDSKTYDGTTTVESGKLTFEQTLTGKPFEDNMPTATGKFEFTSKDAGTNTVNVTNIDFASNGGNYSLSTNTLNGVQVEGSITAKEVTLTWKLDGGDTFTVSYDGTPKAVTATAETGVGSETVNVTVENGTQTNAGTHTATASGLTDGEGGSANNYKLPAEATKQYTISPAEVSFTIGNENKAEWSTRSETNDDPNPDGGYSISGDGTAYSLTMTYDSYDHTVNVTPGEGQLITAAETNGYTVTYKKDGTGDDLTEVRNAGKYDIMVNFTAAEGGAYNFKFTDQEAATHSLKIGTITVAPYDVTVTWSHLSYVYHSHAMHPGVRVDNPFNADNKQMASGLPAGFDTTKPGDYKGDYLVAFGETGNADVGEYPVTVELYGVNAGNYKVTDDTNTVTIVAAPVTFTVGDNIWVLTDGQTSDKDVKLRPAWGEVTTEPDKDEGTDHQYPKAGTNINISTLNTTIEYHQKDGDKVEGTPAEPGTYDVYVKIGNTNFRHAATADGAFHKVGELVITDDESSVQTYTVTFEPGYTPGEGQSAPAKMEKVLPGQTVVLPPAIGDGYKLDRASEHYNFVGWSYSGHTYKPNEEFHMPNSNVIFTAQWEQSHKVTGTVEQGDDADSAKPLPDATVILKQGATDLHTTTTDGDGSFKFENLTPGIYNLVIKHSGIIKTYMVEITDKDVEETYILPSGALNTVVEVKDSDLTVVVDLDALTTSELYDKNAQDAVTGGGTVEFKMEVKEAKVPSGEGVPTVPVPEEQIGMVLDLTLTKTVTPKAGIGATGPTEIPDSKVPVTTVIHLPAELQGKSSYTIYRFHDAGGKQEMQTITTSPNASGEYLELVRDGTAIEIHARLYSVYVLTWAQSSGSSGSSATVKSARAVNGSFSVSNRYAKAGDTVKITPKPNSGYVVDQVVVTDRNGKVVEIKDNGDGTYSFAMPARTAQPVNVEVTFKPDDSEKDCPSEKFADVDQGKWYHEGVDYAIANGLMNGTGADTFAPDAATNRAMVVTILYRLEGEPAVSRDIPFADVPAGQWYSSAITWAAANGIVTGYSETEFGPEDTITREQMAAILYRYAGYKGYDVSGTADLTGYTDAASVSSWASAAMRWAVAEGLIEGTSATTLAPAGGSTRAQVAAVLMRFCEGIAK